MAGYGRFRYEWVNLVPNLKKFTPEESRVSKISLASNFSEIPLDWHMPVFTDKNQTLLEKTEAASFL